MKQILEQLISGQDLNAQQTEQFFGDVVKGEVTPEMLAAVLTALKIKGETPEEIAGTVNAVKAAATTFPPLEFDVVDCVGTGGDGANTINISTTAAIAASACGIKVAKHGNRSVSSKSGSADLLEAFGVNLTMEPQTAAKCLKQTGLCFLFAPKYHSGFRHAAPVRKALGIRTLFNILGPLVNPASPKIMLLGVYTPELLIPMAKALQLTGVKRAWVVFGSGLDEVAIHGDTQVIEIDGDALIERTVSPSDFGLKTYPLSAIEGGTPKENAAHSLAILSGSGQAAHTAAVVINCAVLLYLTGMAASLTGAAKQVQQVLTSGKAAETLKAMAEVSNGRGE